MAAAVSPSNRCIPDHPPYALMIAAAIQHFAEEDGSTEAAISDYIRANYDGLPWAHDRLLPYYLCKLTRMGEFAQGALGRYVTAQDDQASPPPQPPGKQPHGAASMALCPYQAMVASAPPQLRPTFIPKRLGRPPKRSGVGNPAIDRQCGSEPAMPPPLSVIENGDNNCSGSFKRRGRPSKKKRMIDAGAIARTNYDHGQSRTELIPLPMTKDDKILVQYEKHNDERLEYVLALPCQEASISANNIRGEVQRDEAEPAMIRGNTGDNGFAVPKRRGRRRTPKSGPSEEQEIPIACIGTHAVAIIPAAVPAAVEQLPLSMPKRRGRRPKRCGSCSSCNDTIRKPKSTPLLPEPGPRDAEPPPPCMPKRRGRPPKSRSSVCNDNGRTGPKQALTPQSTEVSSVCGDGSSAVRKRCGRPPKRRIINDTARDADRNGRQGQVPATTDVDASVAVPIRKTPALCKARSVKRLECVLALPRQDPLWSSTIGNVLEGVHVRKGRGRPPKRRP